MIFSINKALERDFCVLKFYNKKFKVKLKVANSHLALFNPKAFVFSIVFVVAEEKTGKRKIKNQVYFIAGIALTLIVKVDLFNERKKNKSFVKVPVKPLVLRL